MASILNCCSKVIKRGCENVCGRACAIFCNKVCPCCYCCPDPDSKQLKRRSSEDGEGVSTETPSLWMFIRNEHSLLGLFFTPVKPQLGSLALHHRIILFLFKLEVFIYGILLFSIPNSVEKLRISGALFVGLSVLASVSTSSYSSILRRTHFCQVRVAALKARNLRCHTPSDEITNQFFVGALLGHERTRTDFALNDNGSVLWRDPEDDLLLPLPTRGGMMELAVVQKFTRSPGKLGKLVGKAHVDMYSLDFYEEKKVSREIKNGDKVVVGLLKFCISCECDESIELPEIIWSGLRPLTMNCFLRCLCCCCVLGYNFTGKARKASRNGINILKKAALDKQIKKGYVKETWKNTRSNLGKRRGILRRCSLAPAHWRWLFHSFALALLALSICLIFRLGRQTAMPVLSVVLMTKLGSVCIYEPASLFWEYYSFRLLCPCLMPEYDDDEDESSEEEDEYESDVESGKAPPPQASLQQQLHQPLLPQPA